MSNTMPTVNGTGGETGDGRILCLAELSLTADRVLWLRFFFSQCAFAVLSESLWTWGGCVGVVRNNLATENRRGGGGNNVVRGCWPKSAHSVYGVFTTPSSALATVYADCLWRTLLAFLAWRERWTTTVDSGYPEAFPARSRSAGRAFDHLGREQCQRRPIGL